MGRPERPLNPAAGPVQRFAHELRELRKAAGNPSYRTMAKAAGFSATTLSQAAAGERLPSLSVVQEYVRACGGDPEEWQLRWKEAGQETDRAPAEGAGDTPAPYRGLARFEPGDRHLFFGRDRVVAEVGELVCENRFAVLFGPSGSGKSSLLRAGLIPRLREEIAARGHPARLRILTPGPTPATTYGHLLAPAGDEPESWVVVDQFEEVFTLCRDPRERARFLDLLLAARDPAVRLRVLVAVRADFFARCAEHRGLADALSGAALLLGPMSADELREAVVGPAQAAGCLVERTLTSRLVDEVLDEPGGLPMLSHVLLETWRRRKGRMLTLAGYEAAGGVRGAIAATAEEVYGGLSPGQARAARHLLLRMVEPGQGTPDTRRPLTRAELDTWADPDAPAVVERLTGARLLTADEDGVQLAHEALITCWPRLHDWIEEDRERLRHHRMLADAARTWVEHDRDPGALYRGTRLARAEELFPDHRDDPALTVPERAFLTAALDAREAEYRAASRIVRRHRILTVSLSAVLAVALVTTFAVCRAADENQRRRTQDAARRVADVADALRTTDPRTALLLGAAAWRIAELPESRQGLLGSLAQPETDTFTDPAPGDGPRRALAHGGRILLSSSGTTWSTWDVTAHRRIGTGRLSSGTATDVGADGRVVAVAVDGGMRLWDTATGRWTGGATPLQSDDPHFSGDGRAVLVAEGDRVRLRSVTDGRVRFETRAPNVAVTALSADGRRAAVCPAGQAPQLWDTATRRALPGAWQQKRVCDADTALLALGAGRLAATDGSRVLVWDTTTGRQIADLHASTAQYMSFSPDGAFIATADRGEIRLWRLTSAEEPVLRHSLNNQYLYGGLHWDPDGRTLRYLEGGTVHTLDLGPAVTSAWSPGALDDVTLSPDGRTYATAQRTGDHYVFRLKATADDHVLRTLPPVPVPVPVSADPALPVVPGDTLPLQAFSPDGTRFVYGVSAPGRDAVHQPFTVWDVPRARAVTSLDLPGGAVIGMVLGPRGRTLVAARNTDTGDAADEVWDTGRKRRTTVLTGVTAGHLAVRPDGSLLVGDGRLARLPSGRAAAHDLVQGDEVGALAFAADGSLFAAGDQTGRVALWDGRLGRRLGILRNVFPRPLGIDPEGVSALAFSPDGHTLAVAGNTGGLQLWDVATQQRLGGELTTPGEEIDSVAFSPDGTTLYAGSAHVPLQGYVVDPGRALARVCARAGGTGLTREQWRTYVPDAPYRPVCGPGA
ncbi:helix-turn-helix domain-containing protein [Streptomyces camelliae]|uniref:Helix-turn-helix domain-containing protein n=1 Tax=Streptomyces camelliae TaxID=3004093 RepID=A0ABY7P3D6_9ACTN|nr:helix-turn-helix domain-containing protein [Streptomyces sp. HUAS 2-6]WBO65031.1 helix-turn-helix domain-containing protein [Streptomyces sp. HUAS 2-6]